MPQFEILLDLLSIWVALVRHIDERVMRGRRSNMLTSGTAKKIGKGGLRLAAVLAALQLPVAVAKVAGHSATVGHIGTTDCAGHSTMTVAMSLGQTVVSMVDACFLSQLVHAAGVLLASDSISVDSIASVLGHEVVAHLVSLTMQILS